MEVFACVKVMMCLLCCYVCNIMINISYWQHANKSTSLIVLTQSRQIQCQTAQSLFLFWSLTLKLNGCLYSCAIDIDVNRLWITVILSFMSLKLFPVLINTAFTAKTLKAFKCIHPPPYSYTNNRIKMTYSPIRFFKYISKGGF